jgi:hypothetical protein
MYYKILQYLGRVASVRNKDSVISFKVGAALAGAIRRLPNRSAFIRAAVLSALEHACPLCQGTGILTPEQKRHWDAFARNHAVSHCRDCDAIYLTCTGADRTRRAGVHS